MPGRTLRVAQNICCPNWLILSSSIRWQAVYEALARVPGQAGEINPKLRGVAAGGVPVAKFKEAAMALLDVWNALQHVNVSGSGLPLIWNSRRFLIEQQSYLSSAHRAMCSNLHVTISRCGHRGSSSE